MSTAASKRSQSTSPCTCNGYRACEGLVKCARDKHKNWNNASHAWGLSGRRPSFSLYDTGSQNYFLGRNGSLAASSVAPDGFLAALHHDLLLTLADISSLWPKGTRIAFVKNPVALSETLGSFSHFTMHYYVHNRCIYVWLVSCTMC